MSEQSSIQNTAVLLAAGRGSRMGSGIRKQYMGLCGMPLLAYSLKTLTQSRIISDIVLVIPEGDQKYIEEKIVSRVPGAADKIRAYVPGGAERYNSVYDGICAITWPCRYIAIHDGARPFLDEQTLERLYAQVQLSGTAVAGMPSKDTVKITDAAGIVEDTPDRSRVWIVQTPQMFDCSLITKAYTDLFSHMDELREKGIHITDDAMVVEEMSGTKVQMVEASYRNIKVTTPEDLLIGEAFVRNLEMGRS